MKPFAPFILTLTIMGPSCVTSSAITARPLESDLAFAATIEGKASSPLHQRIFGPGPLDGKRYVEFFKARIKHVQPEGMLFASCHGAFACYNGDRTIRLSRGYERLAVPPVVRLSVLMHEARHAEGWRHELCPRLDIPTPYGGIDLSGRDACDSDPMSATGIQIVMLRNIATYCAQCTPEDREKAAQFADFLMKLMVSESSRKVIENDSVQVSRNVH